MKKHAAPERITIRGMTTPMAIFAARGRPWLGLERGFLLGTEDAGADGEGTDEVGAEDVVVRVAVCSDVAVCTTITLIAMAKSATVGSETGGSMPVQVTPSVTVMGLAGFDVHNEAIKVSQP